jgi:hypothetical protein
MLSAEHYRRWPSFNLKGVLILTDHEELQAVSKNIANIWTLLRK